MSTMHAVHAEVAVETGRRESLLHSRPTLRQRSLLRGPHVEKRPSPHSSLY